MNIDTASMLIGLLLEQWRPNVVEQKDVLCSFYQTIPIFVCL